MSKKVIVSQAPALVQHAEVSNNINLNLNQNDLIDLAIQENLEVLEGKLKATIAELTTTTTEIDRLIKIAAKQIAHKKLKNDKGFTTFMSLVKAGKLELEEANTNHNYPLYKLNSYQNNDALMGSFSTIYDNVEVNNLGIFTRNTRTVNFYKYTFNQVQVNLRVHNQNFSMSYGNNINITPADTKELSKKIEPLNEKWFELMKVKFVLQKEFYEYTYGEKRVKAKIVKASLKKTAEGQAILGMLQGATGVKLLG